MATSFVHTENMTRGASFLPRNGTEQARHLNAQLVETARLRREETEKRLKRRRKGRS